MKRIPIPREVVERIAKEAGLKMCGPDHPVYREGPTITFTSNSRKRPERGVVELPYSGPEQQATAPKASDGTEEG